MSPVFSEPGLCILGIACLTAAVALFVFFTRDMRRNPANTSDMQANDTSDPAEWTAPLRVGSTRAGRRLTTHFREHGWLLPKRTSATGRKLAAATSGKPARQPTKHQPARHQPRHRKTAGQHADVKAVTRP